MCFYICLLIVSFLLRQGLLLSLVALTDSGKLHKLYHANLSTNVSFSFFLIELKLWCNIMTVYGENQHGKSLIFLDVTIWKMLPNCNKKQLLLLIEDS